ncbi:family 16 glycoside hydrolase [Allorhodopirellula solitaria]|uniref:family 16 glycoside hydrolase n=1 Tax=Allorhodopirellula solitaria TaxID=2527987 RepID=UPI001FE28E87|nr:family 16 glycoside hydrolase [Allorhodopirellula solitaria]
MGSFTEITNWDDVSPAHREERDKLKAVLPRFDLFETEQDAPGSEIPPRPAKGTANKAASKSTEPKLTRPSGEAQNWKVTFQDDYENRSEPGARYTTARGHEDSWTVVDGVLVGKQTKDDHGAVIRTELDFDDVDIQFDFRFNGGKSFNLVIDDANEPSVHAGHVCRVSVFQKSLRISDDKTGSMNLEVRKQRQNKNLPAMQAEALRKLLARTQSSATIDIQPAAWHTLRVRIRGDIMKAFLDGQMVTNRRSPGFAHPTKTKFGFTVNGQSIEFDNLHVRQLK